MYKTFCSGYILFAVTFATVVFSGCDDNERVAQIAQEAAASQAEQNREMARQNERIADATKELVTADAQARLELTSMQKDLRVDQAEIGRQRDALEVERQKIDTERKWDRVLAPALLDFGIMLTVAAALWFCWYLLIGLRSEDAADHAVEEILIQELVAEEPLLLPPTRTLLPVIPNHSAPTIEDYSLDSNISKT